MALKDDLVVGACVVGAGWYFLKYMRTNAINTLTDLIPAISPPGYLELQKAMPETIINPTGQKNQFTSALFDYITNQAAGTVYAIRENDPTVYIVLDTGSWWDSGYTKGDIANKASAYYRHVAGLNPFVGYVQTEDTGLPFP